MLREAGVSDEFKHDELSIPTQSFDSNNDALPEDAPETAATPFAFHFDLFPGFCCAFCGAQHKGKHELRKHPAKRQFLGPPLNYQKTEIVSEQKAPDADTTIKCTCNFQEDDGSMAICKVCKTWRHNPCYYYWEESNFCPTAQHTCGDSQPRETDAKGAIKRMNNFLQWGICW